MDKCAQVSILYHMLQSALSHPHGAVVAKTIILNILPHETRLWAWLTEVVDIRVRNILLIGFVLFLLFAGFQTCAIMTAKIAVTTCFCPLFPPPPPLIPPRWTCDLHGHACKYCWLGVSMFQEGGYCPGTGNTSPCPMRPGALDTVVLDIRPPREYEHSGVGHLGKVGGWLGCCWSAGFWVSGAAKNPVKYWYLFLRLCFSPHSAVWCRI